MSSRKKSKSKALDNLQMIESLNIRGIKHLGDLRPLLDMIDNSKQVTVEKKEEPTILDTAKELIYGSRNKIYRHPTENFTNIANAWNAYFQAIKVRPGVLVDLVPLSGNDSISADFNFVINSIDVAYMNILQKTARGAVNQEHEDTIIDIAGYAGCMERILKNR